MVWITEILSDLSFDKSVEDGLTHDNLLNQNIKKNDHHQSQADSQSCTPSSSLSFPANITTPIAVPPLSNTAVDAPAESPASPFNSSTTSSQRHSHPNGNCQDNNENVNAENTVTMDKIEISPIHALSLAYNLYHLYINSVGTDVTIQCSNRSTFQVHSFILCHASPFFKQLLHGIHPPPQGIINLDEMDFVPIIEPFALKCIIESCYTGMLDHHLDNDNVTTILLAAYHLQCHHAYHTCVNYMLHHINYDNCL